MYFWSPAVFCSVFDIFINLSTCSQFYGNNLGQTLSCLNMRKHPYTKKRSYLELQTLVNAFEMNWNQIQTTNQHLSSIHHAAILLGTEWEQISAASVQKQILYPKITYGCKIYDHVLSRRPHTCVHLVDRQADRAAVCLCCNLSHGAKPCWISPDYSMHARTH